MRRRHTSRLSILLVAAGSSLVLQGCATDLGASGDQALTRRGKVIATEDCAICHAVGRVDTSPRAGAPALRELNSRYDVEGLAESLAEGIVVGHASMPAKAYEADEIRSLIAYIKSLKPTSGSGY
jgi:cytochrome c